MDVPEKSDQYAQFTTVSQGGFIDTGADVIRRQAEPAAAVEAIAKAITTPPTAENTRQVTAPPTPAIPPAIPHSNPDWVGAIHVGGDPYSWIGRKIEVLWISNQKWYGQCPLVSQTSQPSIPVRGVHSAVPMPGLNRRHRLSLEHRAHVAQVLR